MNRESPILIADIGATNARLDIVQGRKSKVKQDNYLLEEFNSIESLLKDYLNKTGLEVKRAILGVAAPILGDEVHFINNNFKFSQRELKENMSKDGLRVLNDLELQAHGIKSLSKEDILVIGNKKKPLQGSKILVSPGTGLGLAGVIEGNVMSTEAGHLHVPSNLSGLSSIVEKFETENNRMPSFEDLLSGQGLNSIYRFLSENHSCPYSNEEILSEKRDLDCLRTKEIMIHLLSVFLRYMALIWGASGGVYLSGSIANSLMKDINAKEFRKNFEDSHKMKIFLINTPLFLVLDLNLGLRGAREIALNS